MLNRYLFFFFCLLLMLSPLLFGMVHQLFQALFAVLFLALVVGYAGGRLLAGAGPAVAIRRLWPEAAAFSLLLVWVMLQTQWVTPAGWHHPLWQEAGAALGVATVGSISLTPGAGFAGLMRLLMYGAVFWLALQWGRDRRRAWQLFLVLMAAAVLYGMYGMVVEFADLGKVLWVDKRGAVDSLSGTFINRNNFATYLGLGVIVAAGLYLHLLFQALGSPRHGRDRWHYVIQEGMVKAAPQLAALLLLLTALFLTNSRAGIAATLVALLLLLLLLGPLRKQGQAYLGGGDNVKAAPVLLVGTLLVVLLGVLFLSGDTWWDRLSATELEREARLQRFQETLVAIDQAPLTGYGMGAFQQTYPMFAGLRTSNSDKAHNDWLETIYELGWPAALLWFTVLVTLAGRCLLGLFHRRRDHLYPAAGFTASLLVALHAVVDFSLQIPAVALTFAAILGVAVAQSRSSRE